MLTYKEKINNTTENFPLFIRGFFDSKYSYLSDKTLLGYAYNIKSFLLWLQKYMEIEYITIDDFSNINGITIQYYIDSLNADSYYSVRRKLMALSSLFEYLSENDLYNGNPCKSIELPTAIVKSVNTINDSELYLTISNILKNNNISDKQQRYINITKYRDISMILLFATTGIKVGECVSLNRSDFSYKGRSIKINRGGIISTLYLTNDTARYINKYLKNRVDENDALFISLQNERISIQAVENLISKYFSQVCGYVVTPNNLRRYFEFKFSNIEFDEIDSSILLNYYLGKNLFDINIKEINKIIKKNAKSIKYKIDQELDTKHKL